MKLASMRCLALLGMAFLAFNFSPRALSAQPRSMITVDGDIRLLTTLAAIHAAGFEFETGTAGEWAAIRQRLDAAIKKEVSEDLRERLKQFYVAHREGGDRAAQISKYVSLALVLDQPPKFGFIWGKDKLPPDVLPIMDFEPLLKEFYEAAQVERMWSQMQPELEALITRYQNPIMRTIQQTEGYLRLPSASYLGRHYFILVDPFGSVTGSLARNYGEDYYLVIPPTSQPNLDDLRHQFLHFVMDPLSLKVANRFYHKRTLLELAAHNSNLDAQFKSDFMLLTTECLIRAIELRMRKLPASKVDDELTRHAVMGFFLIRHFYDQLLEFEKSEPGIREAWGDWVEAIDMEKERKYVASLALVKPPMPSPAPKIVKSESQKKLDEAEDLLSEEKYELAKKIFRQIVDTDESLQARALYGMGVAASLQRDLESARSYFEQALAHKNVDGATQAWSRIYLGRLYDLEGDRKRALQEYAAAVQTGDDTKGAQAAAKRGLEKPFSGKEKERP